MNLISYGELLHDQFPPPHAALPGGAPANLAIHASALGARSTLISSVGRDTGGQSLLSFVQSRGVNSRAIQQHPFRSSGRVTVSLAHDRSPSYLIHEGVAWDYIHLLPAAISDCTGASLFCFGTLAQRSPVSRLTLERLIDFVPENALRVFDVNLRQNFWSHAILEFSFQHADLVKISDEELPTVGRTLGLPDHPEAFARSLIKRYNHRAVAVTLGAKGSLIATPGGMHHHPGFPVEVVDTVGAGDAFTAVLSIGWSLGRDPDWINAQANRIASFVCSRSGATPPLPVELTKPFQP